MKRLNIKNLLLTALLAFNVTCPLYAATEINSKKVHTQYSIVEATPITYTQWVKIKAIAAKDALWGCGPGHYVRRFCSLVTSAAVTYALLRAKNSNKPAPAPLPAPLPGPAPEIADATMLALAVTAHPQNKNLIKHILTQLKEATPECSVCQQTLADCMKENGNNLCHANDKCAHIICANCKQGMLAAERNPDMDVHIVDGHRLERPVIIRASKCPACNVSEAEENRLPAFLTTITAEQRAQFAQLQAEFNRSRLPQQQPAPAALDDAAAICCELHPNCYCQGDRLFPDGAKVCAICTFYNNIHARECEICEARL
ncbi:MAG: hypothetical protein NT124_04655 [Candidatus Dependentiae bacterium]|nr:hypothetical protein [Candidatus Dependentiae bacterium]